MSLSFVIGYGKIYDQKQAFDGPQRSVDLPTLIELTK